MSKPQMEITYFWAHKVNWILDFGFYPLVISVKKLHRRYMVGDHLFSMLAKFSEELLFLTR